MNQLTAMYMNIPLPKTSKHIYLIITERMFLQFQLKFEKNEITNERWICNDVHINKFLPWTSPKSRNVFFSNCNWNIWFDIAIWADTCIDIWNLSTNETTWTGLYTLIIIDSKSDLAFYFVSSFVKCPIRIVRQHWQFRSWRENGLASGKASGGQRHRQTRAFGHFYISGSTGA